MYQTIEKKAVEAFSNDSVRSSLLSAAIYDVLSSASVAISISLKIKNRSAKKNIEY